MYTYLTYLSYLTYGSLSKQAKPSQGKSSRLQTKKGYQILSLKSFCQIIYTGKVYTPLSLSLSSIPFSV